MSNATWHPALQNFHVKIRYVWANPGTMCALVIMLGSHGISILYVCVDFIAFPFSKMILIGNLDGCLFNNGAHSISKCSVTPDSEKYHCTAHFSFNVLTLVASIGSSRILLACTIVLPAVYFWTQGVAIGCKNMLH